MAVNPNIYPPFGVSAPASSRSCTPGEEMQGDGDDGGWAARDSPSKRISQSATR